MGLLRDEDAGRKKRREMVRLLSALIAKDTSDPPGNEYLAARVVKAFFTEHGIRYRTFEKEKGRTNIIGYIGSGKPRLMLACHMDTVPPGDGWISDPFKAKIRGDRLYGRGAVDDKGPLAGVLMAAAAVKKDELRLRGQVIIACVADEERGSGVGMDYLLSEGKVDAEYAIVPDTENQMHKIDIAEKGLLFLKVTSVGKQAHGSTPDKGVNAIWNMLQFLEVFRKYRMRFKRHRLLSPPTINLGVIRGGEAVNIVPAECSMRIDIRYLPSQRPGQIASDVIKMFALVRRKNRGAVFRLEILEDQKPVEVAADNELVRSIKRHVKAVMRTVPETIGISGTTLVKPLAANGITAVGFSAGKNISHTSNEYISISELIRFSKIIRLVCLDLLK